MSEPLAASRTVYGRETAMAESAAQVSPHLSFLRRQESWKRSEFVFWLALVGVYFAFPTSLLFASQILITGLFAMSLDVILGYAGIVTLGHAAFFGVGAYTAGLLASHGWSDPILGLLAAGAVAGVAGYLSSFLLSRGSDLTRLMITLGIALLLHELGNTLSEITGGVDGLQGVVMGKIFGLFDFDLYGKTGYLYVLVVSFLLFAVTRSMMQSPYGLALRSMRESKTRALAIGIPITACLSDIYTISAVIAGIAGALLTQTTQFVGLDVLGFQRSADLLIMLTIGGTATLYGGFIGAAAFMLVQNSLSDLNPQYWEGFLGVLLIVMTLYLRGGLLGGLSKLSGVLRARRGKERP